MYNDFTLCKVGAKCIFVLFQTCFAYFRGQNVKCLINIKEFLRKMRSKWFFRDKPTKHSSARLSFRVKPNWKTPNRRPAIEMFLSKLEKRSSLCVAWYVSRS